MVVVRGEVIAVVGLGMQAVVGIVPQACWIKRVRMAARPLKLSTKK